MKASIPILMLLSGCARVVPTETPALASSTPVEKPTPQPSPLAPPAGATVIQAGPKWQEQAVRCKGTVYLGAGNFSAEALELNGEVRWVGAGPEFTHILSSVEESAITHSRGRLQLEQLSLSHQGDKTAYLIRVASSQLELKNCHLSGATSDALLLFTGARAHLDSCRFFNNQSRGVSQAEGTSAQASRCVFEDHGSVTWHSPPGSNTTLANCTFVRSRYAGTYLDGDGSKLVQGCHYSDCNEEGVVVGNATVASVCNSTFERIRVNGIEVHGQVDLRNNVVNEGSDTGVIFLDDSSGSATNNSCQGQRLSGIEVGGTAHPRLRQNRCTDNQQAGISFWQQAAGEVSDNTLEGNLHGGLRIEAPSRPKVGTNRFASNGEGETIHCQP